MKLKLFLPVFFIINISADPYPIDYWAVDPGMSNVNVSLNGKYISYEKASKRSDVQLEILETDNLSSEPFIVTGDVMEIITSDWVSDDQLIIILDNK